MLILPSDRRGKFVSDAAGILLQLHMDGLSAVIPFCQALPMCLSLACELPKAKCRGVELERVFSLCCCKPRLLLSHSQIIAFPALRFGALVAAERLFQSFLPFFKPSQRVFMGSLYLFYPLETLEKCCKTCKLKKGLNIEFR